MAKIKNGKEFDKLLDAINGVLSIKESWYECYLVDTKGYEVDDFTMPNGLGLISTDESTKSIIAISYEKWEKAVEATNEKDRRKHYAKIAGILSHELMHIHQYKYACDKYMKDFMYESKLPKNTDKWTVLQRKKIR